MRQYIVSIVYEIKESHFANMFKTNHASWEKAIKTVSNCLITPSILVYLILIVVITITVIGSAMITVVQGNKQF